MHMMIGIDLGTTNCLAAYFKDGKPQLIPNQFGAYLTPSVISVDDEGTFYVGAAAKERKIKYPQQTVEVFKRSMGTEKVFQAGSRKMDAVTLSSIMLKNLKEDAERFLGESVTEAIISVPAYFNELQRKATTEAGRLAGLQVKRIINEPTAAALAYGIDETDLEKVVLAFDLGGGTFDVSILEFDRGVVEVHAIAGDNYIGGEDFTLVLMDLFCKKAEIAAEKLSQSQQAHIKNQCEAGKKAFSERNQIKITCSLGGSASEAEITIEEYEAACKSLMEKLRQPIEQSMRDTSFKTADIDDIILVGGGTKLPMIKKFISKLFGRFPNLSVNPDEAVALGAAIQCAMSRRDAAMKEVVLTDVCPFTLGTSTLRKGSGKLDDQVLFFPIIERNTVIPVSKTELFYTVEDGQTRIAVDVLQGESRFVKNNLLLGTVNMKVPPGPAGSEAIKVTYTYDVNALLEVKVKVMSTGQEKIVILQQSGTRMTEEEARAKMEELEHLKILPKDQEVNQQVVFRGERLYEESLGDVRLYIQDLLYQFDVILAKQDKNEIAAFRKELIRIFDEIEEGN